MLTPGEIMYTCIVIVPPWAAQAIRIMIVIQWVLYMDWRYIGILARSLLYTAHFLKVMLYCNIYVKLRQQTCNHA